MLKERYTVTPCFIFDVLKSLDNSWISTSSSSFVYELHYNFIVISSFVRLTTIICTLHIVFYSSFVNSFSMVLPIHCTSTLLISLLSEASSSVPSQSPWTAPGHHPSYPSTLISISSIHMKHIIPQAHTYFPCVHPW